MSYNGAISNRDGVVSSREKVRCGSIQMVIKQPHQLCKICKLHVSLWNVGRMHGRVSEIVATIGHRGINICCVQESSWKGCSARFIWAKGLNISQYKSHGVRLNHRIMSVCILLGKLIITILSVYAPQTGLSVAGKDSPYSALLSNISTDEYLLACVDFNGLVGKAPKAFNGVHGGHGFGSHNADGIRILDLCSAANLAITNIYFMKPNSHLVTYWPGNSCS